jgi:hypothetical protein
MASDGETSLYIYRHAFSCANYKKELGGLSRIAKAGMRDPLLTYYGIIQSLLQDTDFVPFTPYRSVLGTEYVVHVSCLIRTWQTAILLFGHKVPTNLPERKLVLRVAPFIKESGLGLDNMPGEVESQINIIANFVALLRGIQAGVREKNGLDDETYGIINNKIARIVTLTSITVQVGDTRHEVNLTVPAKMLNDKYINSIAQTAVAVNSSVDLVKSTAMTGGAEYSGFYLESDINKYIDHLLSYSDKPPRDIAVVTHNNILREFIKKCKPGNTCLIQTNKGIRKKENTWGLQVQVHYKEDGGKISRINTEVVDVFRGKLIPGRGIRNFIEKCEYQCGNYDESACASHKPVGDNMVDELEMSGSYTRSRDEYLKGDTRKRVRSDAESFDFLDEIAGGRRNTRKKSRRLTRPRKRRTRKM